MNLDSLGRVTEVYSRDASLASRFSDELPQSVADLLTRVGLQGVPSDHPKMSTLYDPKAIQQKNHELLQEKRPTPLAEKLLAQTDKLKSTLAQLKG